METLKCFQGPCGAHFFTAAAAFSAVVLSDSHRFGHRVSPALKGAQLQACVQRGCEPQMWRLKWFQSLLTNCFQFYKRKAHLVGWNGTFSSTPFPKPGCCLWACTKPHSRDTHRPPHFMCAPLPSRQKHLREESQITNTSSYKPLSPGIILSVSSGGLSVNVSF